MAADPTIILFWSYKGGQGRTWACANVALDLAFRGGARVLILDADFKAPGIHYYFRPFTWVDPSARSFGFIDGVLRWYLAYSRSALARAGEIGFDYTDSDRFLQLLRTMPVPDPKRDLVPSPDAGSESAPGGRPAGGQLAEVVTSINLEKLRSQFAADEPALLPAQVGELWLAHCGDIQSVGFRKDYGEGYPWRILTDPRSAQAQQAPITFAEAFYAAAAHLARVCGAEYVFVDLPAGVSNLAEQLIDPGRPIGSRQRFQWGEPSALVVVSSVAHQALEGSAALLRGDLLEPPHQESALLLDRYRPEVVRERRAIVLYNLLHESLFSLRDVIERHGQETGLPVHFPVRSVLPPDGFEAFPRLAMSEWLVLLPEARHAYVEGRTLLRDDLAPMRVKALDSLEAWTRTDFRRRGHIPRLRASGAFWTEARIELPELPPDLVIAGEDVPALDAFIAQLLESWQDQGGLQPRLTVYRFDHQSLFDALPLSETVNELRDALGLERLTPVEKLSLRKEVRGAEPQEAKNVELSLQDLWRVADAVAVPHYLLGRVSGMGIADLEHLLGSASRESLEQQVVAFSELCCYRGVWCAFPFSVLAKLIFSRRPLGADRRRISDLQSEAAVRSGQSWILTEAKADSLSLWYEWEQLLVSSGGRLVSRNNGDEVGRLIDGTRGGPAVEAVYRCVELYWRLIRSQRAKDIGRIDWTNAVHVFSECSDYLFHLGWSDWISSPHGLDHQQTRAPRLFFGSLPVEDVSSPRQPLEGWSLALPEPPGDDGAGDSHRLSMAGRALQILMSGEWQARYQLQGGCSAFGAVLRDPEIRAEQPWVPFVSDAVTNAIPKGKSRTAPEYARSVTSFLTAVLFLHPEDLHLADDEEVLRKRFDAAWPPFYNALLRLRNEERLI